MKLTPITYERRRTYTLEQSVGDFNAKDVEYKNGMPELPLAYVRKALLNDASFCLDVMAYGFPTRVQLLPTDTDKTLDVVVYWIQTF